MTACGGRSGLELATDGSTFDDETDSVGGTAPGGGGSGGQGAGGQGSGGQGAGGQSTGGQSSGGQNTGGQSSGGQSTGGQSSGGQNTGGQAGCSEGYIDEGRGCQPLLTALWLFEGTVAPPIHPTERNYVATVPIWGLPLYLVARFPRAANTHITPDGGDATQAEEMLLDQPWRAPSLLPGQTSNFDLIVSEEDHPSSSYTVALYREGLFHYVKASNTGADDGFGYRVALSADGRTLAVGAPEESSGIAGINGNQLDNTAANAGAVYVFIWENRTWTQQAYMKASNAGAGDNFGSSVDLSGDGNVLIVGARLEASGATGINGNELDDSSVGAGAAYVFSRSGETWHEDAYLKASNTGVDDQFGASVAVSADGETFAVGAPNERSSAHGVGGDQNLDDAFQAGAVYVFSLGNGTFVQEAYVKSSNATGEDRFGSALDLSADGNTLVVGAPLENSFASGIDGDQTDFGASAPGAAYSFLRQGSTWSQNAYIKASETSEGALFGSSVALSGDGSTLAVGAAGHIDDTGQSGVGAAYVLVRSASSWIHEGYFDAENAQPEAFGSSLALSYDGNVLIVGAPHERSPAAGINGDPLAEPIQLWAGAAYRFERAYSSWERSAYIKASKPDSLDLFGTTVGVTGDGTTVVVGASWQDSAATGVDGDPGNHDASRSGAVYSYTEE